MRMLYVNLQYENLPAEPHALALPVELGRGHPLFVRKHWLLTRQHACIFARPSGLFLKDYGSLLGTRLNGDRVIQEQVLWPGDKVQLGPYCLTILDPPLALDPLQQEEQDKRERRVVSTEQENGVLSVKEGAQANDQEHLWAVSLRLHQNLLERLDLPRRDIQQLSAKDLYHEAYAILGELLQNSAFTEPERRLLQDRVCDEALGLGVLEKLLKDDSISEIMVNHYDAIFIERAGLMSTSGLRFSSEQALRAVVERILAPLGRRLDDQSPMVDARLPDGSRVNAVIPPIALYGCKLTIRKFPQQRMDMQAWVQAGCLSVEMAQFLRQCVLARASLLLSGGTGTGKTSLLQALSVWIPQQERIITIEDAAELRILHPNSVALEARPANSEGQGKVSIRDLVRNALRMRPDRIIVGECRGPEAFDMLSAMNTGHEGSLSTLHANSPRDALVRLESMVLMAGMDLPLSVVREHIVAAVHCIVQLQRLPCGKRVVSEIAEITGMESGTIQTQALFRLEPDPNDPFRAPGPSPRLCSVLRARQMQPEALC